jgi:tRNA-2-methylthio-N6-dimethylallyladenosine synthase
MRIRFSTSNPQDMALEVIDTMARHPNICNYIHLPVQSGSDRILKAMNRLHTRAEYFELIDGIRERIPDCGISHDMIAGFPGETEEDHQQTLSLMEYVRYDFGFMFAYSERPGTLAARKLPDDVPEEVKKRRLREIIALQQEHSLYRNQKTVGQVAEVLIEGDSRKSDAHWMGRTSQNTVVVFPKEHYRKGEFVHVKIEECTSATLLGRAVGYSQNNGQDE